MSVNRERNALKLRQNFTVDLIERIKINLFCNPTVLEVACKVREVILDYFNRPFLATVIETANQNLRLDEMLK